MTTEARPVRAPSPTPGRGLDVGGVGRDRAGTTGGRRERVDEQDLARMFGGMPSSSSRPASAPIATIVPIVSKKSASISVKTSRTAATTPTLANEPNRLKWPSSPKSGTSTILSGSFGTFRPQPAGLTTCRWRRPAAPILAIASTMIARTVAPRMRDQDGALAPCATIRATIASTGRGRRRATGQPFSVPPMPSSTGTGAGAGAADEARVDEADERDEQADADRDRGLELRRDGVEHRLPEAGQHQHQDDRGPRGRPGPSRRPRSSRERRWRTPRTR